jgi:ornithine cyclodeaminase/alanine dehydrogenase
MMHLLTRDDVASLFTLDEYIASVESAFAAYAEGRTLKTALLHVDGVGGEFHVKAGGLDVDGHTYFGLKANGGFFGNAKHGRPAIQGVIYLADATTGTPLAILDSIHITIQRTGAATAVAARYLARTDSSVVTICGAGRQGRIQLTALTKVFALTRAYVWDRVGATADQFARDMTAAIEIPVLPVANPVDGTRCSDIVVTCTPATQPYITPDHVRPGTFIAAVGADSPEKQELDPLLLSRATVVTDVTAQCARVGELHHALEAALMREEDVHAEIGEIIVGRKSGRRSYNEITIYDATGTALQDTACAAAIYVKAMAAGRGTPFALA